MNEFKNGDLVRLVDKGKPGFSGVGPYRVHSCSGRYIRLVGLPEREYYTSWFIKYA